VREVEGCHLLYISSSELSHLLEIFKALETSSILTITEVDGLVHHSGMINLIVQQKTLGFEIDRATAEKANLKLDTQLLRLAKTVRN
jgi:hypothetical protein